MRLTAQVLDVIIFEVTAPGWPEEEAVRIFIKFDQQASAVKARIDLEVRGGGRQNGRARCRLAAPSSDMPLHGSRRAAAKGRGGGGG